ncbi:MAG TPA: hypothetical protein ENF83_04595 [Candidatus Korarchaeota archaeon]|nr:hypothetical protein [Candidatus Korarchaeota archaeon]
MGGLPMFDVPFPALARPLEGDVVILGLKLRPDNPPLSEIMGVLEEQGARVLGGIQGVVGPEFAAMFVVELRKGVRADELRARVAGIEGVLEVRASGSRVGDLWVNDVLNGLLLMGDRAGVIPLDSTRSLFEAVRRYWGPAGEAFLYHMGVAAGKDSYQKLAKIASLDGREMLELFLGALKSCGWISWYEIAEFSEQSGRAVVRLRGSFECSGQRGETKRSNILRGILTGFISAIWRTPTVGEEVKCEAIGDPYDEISVRAMKI